MEFQLLGPIGALAGGRPVELGHARQRYVLAALLADVGRPVTADRLLDRVWGVRPPDGARSTLRSYLCRLRQVLGPARIVRRAGGYLADVDPAAVDLHRFRRLVAAGELDTALTLWRDEPLGGLDTPWSVELRAALEAERLAAELDRNDALLAGGDHAGVLAAAVPAAVRHPLDERLAGQLLTALNLGGRQAEALAHYERLRRRLADELGTDPGTRLRALHRQILAAAPARRRPPRPVPRQLPPLPATFTGRKSELDALAGAALTVVRGPGGVGKTWLALRWAHEHADRFPDGQLYVNLRGFDPAREPVAPATAVRGFLAALGVDATAVPAATDDQVALYRSHLADRRMLVVLDNARDSGQVEQLLPGSPTCAVVVTSRSRLAGLIARQGARSVPLDMLTATESEQVLAGHLGARAGAEPDAVAALVRHCAGLPLALGIVAGRAALDPHLPLSALAAELSSARLNGLAGGELSVDLRAVLACSVAALRPAAATMFGLLGQAPGPDIGLPAAAALADGPVEDVRLLLRDLADGHLVAEYQPGRYRMHDLVRLYAAEVGAADRPAALERVLDHYARTALAADRLLDPHRDGMPVPVTSAEPVEDALAWFDREYAVLLPALRRALDDGFDGYVRDLSWGLSTYLDRRGRWHDREVSQRAALRAADRLADRSMAAYARRGVAQAQINLGRYAAAAADLEQALTAFAELGDRTGQALTRRGLARVHARQGRPDLALPHDRRALALFRAEGHRVGQATVLNAIGWHHANLGQHRPALAYCGQALALYTELGHTFGQALTWDSLGYAWQAAGERPVAIECFDNALALFRVAGDRFQQADTLRRLGTVQEQAGDRAAARESWSAAVSILDDLGHPSADAARVELARLA